jgi:serine/threonine protein kinase
MSAPQLPEGATVAITISSKAGEIKTTVTLGELLGSGGAASIYRIAAATPDPPIQTDGPMTPLTELVLRLEHPETGALAHRRDAIKFLQDRRPTDPELGALVPVYASGKGTSTQVDGYQGETALSVQVLRYAGVDLGKAMGDGLGWTRVCQGLAGVARTLSRLHELGWAHRDISPGNLFTGFPLTWTPEFLLGDLGIITRTHEVRPARKDPDGTTTLTQAWSKGPYTPPEVLAADDGFIRVTKYLDVWQLATTMTMLATGRLPFLGWIPGGDLRRQLTYTDGVLNGRFDPDVIKDAPAALKDVLAKAWEPEPSERPTLAELASALEGAAKPLPVTVPVPALVLPEPNPRSWGRTLMLRSSQVAAALLMVAGAVLLAGLTGHGPAAALDLATSSPRASGQTTPPPAPTTTGPAATPSPSASPATSTTPPPTVPSQPATTPPVAVPAAPAFATVDLPALCNSPAATLHETINFMGSGCKANNQTTVVGSTAFTWEMLAPANTPAQAIITFGATSCRSITLRFALDPSALENGLAATLSVVQGGTAVPQSATSSGNIVTLHANLNGGPWVLMGKTTIMNGGEWSVFVSGHASCSTADGAAS